MVSRVGVEGAEEAVVLRDGDKAVLEVRGFMLLEVLSAVLRADDVLHVQHHFLLKV
jgi:hypothetical protein